MFFKHDQTFKVNDIFNCWIINEMKERSDSRRCQEFSCLIFYHKVVCLCLYSFWPKKIVNLYTL